MPFWQSLVFTGSFTIGLKERTTQYHEAGKPSFPNDFDGISKAGEEWALKKQAELRARWERRPPGKRAEWQSLGTRSPWKPDWDEVLKTTTLTPDGDTGMIVDTHEASPLQSDQHTGRPWLIRPPLTRCLDGFASDPARASELLAQINSFRRKRGLPETQNADDIFYSAVISVRIDVIGKGSPDDLAIIYRVGSCHRSAWLAAETERKEGRFGTTRLGFEQPLKTGIEKVTLLRCSS